MLYGINGIMIRLFYFKLLKCHNHKQNSKYLSEFDRIVCKKSLNCFTSARQYICNGPRMTRDDFLWNPLWLNTKPSCHWHDPWCIHGKPCLET